MNSSTTQGVLKIQAAGLSDRGMKRGHNEDSLSVVPSLGLFVVADGMGGHNAGEVASRQAIESMVEFLRDIKEDPSKEWPYVQDPELGELENKAVVGVKLANRDVCKLSMEHPEYQGMGTTLVSLLFDPKAFKACVSHVGDSRAYRLRNGALDKITSDHSWVEEQLQRGIISADEAKNHRWKNVITRALGNKLDVEVDAKAFDLEDGDVYLLCSDGLSAMLDEEYIGQIMISQPDLEDCAHDLIEAANAAGGSDNISVILIRTLKG